MPGDGAPLVHQHPPAALGGKGRHLRDPGGVTQYIAPFIANSSETAWHMDHITVQVAKDRARYALDPSPDGPEDRQTLGFTRVPTRCQPAATALVGTRVHHGSASVCDKAARMFWELAGAHGIPPKVNYPVPEFASVAAADFISGMPRAQAALGVGLYNPIQCLRMAHIQL